MTTLLSPLSFSGLSLRNRIAMPPMWSGKATPEGLVTDAIIRDGQADIACVGRAMLDDPDWARRAIDTLSGNPGSGGGEVHA